MSTGSGNSGSQGNQFWSGKSQGIWKFLGKVRENWDFGNFFKKNGQIFVVWQILKNGKISAEITCIELHFQVIL